MNSTFPERNFTYIRDAAELRLLLELWRKDQEFSTLNKKVFYAVDTDVVKLYSNPGGVIEYTTIFSSDDDQTCQFLAWAIGRFIFFRLTKDRPLLVIPPHHIEMDRVFAAIAADASKERDKTSVIWPRLESYVREYRKTRDMDAFIASIEKEPLNLVRFVYGEGKGYNAELSRITELLRNDRILNLECYVEANDNKQRTLPLLNDAYDSRDYDTLTELTKPWFERLKATKSKIKGISFISDDAEVLARLEWANRELEERGERLLLISGDPAIHRAAAGYSWDSNHNFAELFIRHPKIFLAAKNFLTVKQVNEAYSSKILETGLIEWLDLFLTRYQAENSSYLEELRKVINLSEEEGDELANDFRDKVSGTKGILSLKHDWEEFVRLTAVEYGLKSDREYLQQFGKMIAEDNVELALKKVEKKTSEVAHSFWQVATTAGLWSTNALVRETQGIMDTKQVLPIRGVPALRLTLEPVSTQVRKICTTLRYEDIINRKYTFNKLKKNDPSGYTAFLLYALAMGAMGRWKATYTLAEFTMRIAAHEAKSYSLPDEYEPITGNEAAYLLAWAARHMAKNVGQLHEARRYLEEAKVKKAEAVGGHGDDVRYESESIALDVTYNLFQLFLEEPIPNDIPHLAKCQERALELLRRLENNKNEEEYIKITVEKQVLSYLFCVLILQQFKERQPGVQKEIGKISQWLNRFNVILEKTPSAITCFTKPMYLVATYLYGEKTLQEKSALAAKEILNPEKVQRCYVMPYDKAFYGFLYDLVTSRHGGTSSISK